MYKTDTIVAIATGLSNAGISIVRLSGDSSFQIIDKVYRSGSKKLSNQESHTIHYGYIVDGDEVIDEVMVSIMRNPRSYTREDVIEINCHGGIVVTRRVLEVLVKNGARIAEPGEFTKRAFLNGRIDLTQAEAIMDLIHAKNELSRKNSLNLLKGDMGNYIKELRVEILRNIAYIEAALDDPEHISLLGFADKLSDDVINEKLKIEHLLRKATNGRMIKEGIRTAIVGKPNSGKSSLLNMLLGQERAIVTDIAGTTRDTLEEYIDLNGVSLHVIDTAGIRNTEDVVEKIGVDKAKKMISEADLVLYVVDSTMNLDKDDAEILELLHDRKVIILLNKVDIDSIITRNDMIEFIKETNQVKNSTDMVDIDSKNLEILYISAREGTGITELENKICNMFFEGSINLNDDLYITSERQKEALMAAKSSLDQVEQSLRLDMPEDFYSIDLMNAYEELGKLTGESVEDDLVNMIFKEFCMGK